jgi:2-hydroxychromene-2-carboxylate isomerase
MSEKIDAVAARYGRKVRWHPILLGVIFKATGSAPLTLQAPPRPPTRSTISSVRRASWAFPTASEPLPAATQNAARAYYWLHGQDCALARQFAHAVYRALFVDDQDISAPETVIEIAAKLGVDRSNLENALQSPEIKARLKDEVDNALAAGVFGSPHVFIDGEPFSAPTACRRSKNGWKPGLLRKT